MVAVISSGNVRLIDDGLSRDNVKGSCLPKYRTAVTDSNMDTSNRILYIGTWVYRFVSH